MAGREGVSRIAFFFRKLAGPGGLDCIDVSLATRGLDTPSASHTPGPVFWSDARFVSSRLRYARLHRPVFHEIRDSVVGHREFVSPEPPPGTWVDRLEAEAEARVLHAAIRKARVLFTLTRHMAWEVERLYGRTPIPIKGAVSPTLFGYRARRDVKRALGLDGRRVVLNVNRLDPRKRVGLVLQAFALIAPEQVDLHLLIGGTGPQEAQLPSLARELGVAQRVTFPGYIPEDELPDYLVACDVFVHPNWADFAISPYEALALRRKVVGSSEMEVDDDLRRGDNLFVAAPTVEAMAAAIRAALATPSRAPAHLSNYTWDVYAGRVLEALRRAVGKR